MIVNFAGNAYNFQTPIREMIVMQWIEQKNWLLTSIVSLIFISAWILQNQFFLSWDIGWLVHATNRMIMGGNYTQNFFETNPPLILYLYLPPILLHKLLPIKLALCLRGYFFLLAALSLFQCHQWCKKLFSKSDPTIINWITITLSIVYLILPLYELGQRDHLLILFTMPYLLMVVYRLQDKKVNLTTSMATGLMGAIGFAIKPHFLLTPLLIELYCIFKKKNFRFFWRPEIVVLLGFVTAYLLSIYLIHRDYYDYILPYTMRLYYQAVSMPYGNLIAYPSAFFCLFPFFLAPWMGRFSSTGSALIPIFFLALLDYYIAYIMQRTTFYYHIIPPLSMATLLMTLLFRHTLQGIPIQVSKIGEAVFAGLLGATLFVLPAYSWIQIYTIWHRHPANIAGLVDFLRAHAKAKPVYFFTSTTVYTFPTVDDAGVKYASRFPFLWMVAGLVNDEQAPHRHADKKRLVQMICEDFQKNTPALVLIDIDPKKPYIARDNFDYLKYFGEYSAFATEWKNYHYLTTIEQKYLYKLAVYQRNTDFNELKKTK